MTSLMAANRASSSASAPRSAGVTGLAVLIGGASRRVRSRGTSAGVAARPACGPVPNSQARASAPSRATTISFWMLFFASARRVNASSSGLSSTKRIERSCMIRSSSKREIKGRAPVGGALGPDLAAVAVDDPLYRGEPDPRAGELAGRVQPLKRAEQLGGVRHVESGAVVAHEKCPPTVVRHHADLHVRGRPLARALPGVAEQVL